MTAPIQKLACPHLLFFISINRFAVRHALRLLSKDNSTNLESMLSPHVNSLKRLCFPKLLRILPLAQQVAVVDACAFLLDRVPKLITIDDQNLLAFVSELLKMINIADGEFADPAFGEVVLIDKDGLAVDGGGGGGESALSRATVRASSLLLRRAIILEDATSFGGRVRVPAELSMGEQLRVSTILLFRGLIRGFPDDFCDADPQTKVGNIRPHVISAFFRSLISYPAEAVSVSASALHDALSLFLSKKQSGDEDDSAVEGKTEEEDGTSSLDKGYRVSKELIQSCMRPVLINFREFSKLSVPLLRGMSHLLELLTSWFNKSIGEKLLEHLHRFAEPGKTQLSSINKLIFAFSLPHPLIMLCFTTLLFRQDHRIASMETRRRSSRRSRCDESLLFAPAGVALRRIFGEDDT